MAKVWFGSNPNIENGDKYALIWDCPGCGCSHQVYIKPIEHLPGKIGPVWTFNGDVDKPTIHPSVLVNPNNDPHYLRCHCWIREGQIVFCDDCGHDLKNQTVPMKDVDHD